MAMKILLVDDEPSIRMTLGDAVEEAGHRVVRCGTAGEARSVLEDGAFDCFITDMRLPDGDGIQLLKEARERNPGMAMLVITGHGTIETAVEATKMGAEYILKPFLNEDVLARLAKIEELRSLREENERLRTQITGRFRIDRIIGKSARMQELFDVIETIGPSDATVLITGESGTGKELVAQAIHRNSPRCSKKMIKVSCAALPESLLEDELFGHEKGAFTDARERKIGRFELAHGSSIFLDDIDDMSLPTQVKLLRVLQEREFERLGGTTTIKVDVRVIAATKQDLALLVRQARFRDDLYFRLHVVRINLPPLRERMEDLPLLCEHFIRLHGGNRRYTIDEETMRAMAAYSWPGNVRELENAIMRAIAMAGRSDRLDIRHLLPQAASDAVPVPFSPAGTAIGRASPGGIVGGGIASGGIVAGRTTTGGSADEGFVPGGAARPGDVAAGPAKAAAPELRPLRDVVAEAEAAHIRAVLQHAGGNRTRAAEILGISRKNLWEKMREYNIS
ncbi:MAG: sigma-54 dependent transcriptional regulator [Planctomycetota bacterium]|nr:sigma-54 dependent transcriptional regulator [Planctomycetota bacterium]